MKSARAIFVIIVGIFVSGIACVSVHAIDKKPPRLNFIRLYPNCEYKSIGDFPRDYGVEHNIKFRTRDTRDKIFKYFYQQLKPNGWQIDELDYTYRSLIAYRGRVVLRIHLYDATKPGYKSDVSLVYRIYSHAKPPKKRSMFRYILTKPYNLPGVPVYPGAKFISGTYEVEITGDGKKQDHHYHYKTTAALPAVYKYLYGYVNRSKWKITSEDKLDGPNDSQISIRAEKEYKSSKEEIDLNYNITPDSSGKGYNTEYWVTYRRQPM